MRCRLAGEVSRLEFLDGGTDVVDVEKDAGCHPAIGVDLDDAEHLGVECVGPLVSPREADTHQGEALPADGDHGRRPVLGPEVGGRPHVRDFGISTMSDPGVHYPPTIVCGNVVGQYLAHRGPVAGREVHLEALFHLGCRVFQPRRWPAEFVELRKRGIDIGLVENLGAAYQVAFDRHDLDQPPLCVEALV